jgi:Zn-dependent metalloprotease
MNHMLSRTLISTALLAVICTSTYAAPTSQARNPEAIQRLEAERGGTRVSINPATGTARFVRLPPSAAASAVASTAVPSAQAMRDSAATFINLHARAFGLSSGVAELHLQRAETDSVGATHISYTQQYAGLPVFGAVLKVHLDAAGQVSVVTGTLVPDITLSAAPARNTTQVEKTALQYMQARKPDATLTVRGNRLLIFREGLAKGVPGQNHLAYEVEVGNGSSVREFVYIDAHNGKFIDRISGAPDSLNRRAYDGQNLPDVPPSYPGSPFWVEGQPFPTGNVEADNMIRASKDTYNMYFNAFGRDSFDGKGATMDSIFDRGYSCPNASWNGVFISFCPGFTADDITAHEWSHAYTQYTDDLIYQWQPGALNEASSDIFGETVDRINGRGLDTPNRSRTAGSCSARSSGTPPPKLTVNSPAAIAGSYGSLSTVLHPTLPVSVTGAVAASSPADACTAVSGVKGKIALIDWAGGACGSVTKTGNAFAAGAIGAIIVADPTGLIGLTGSASLPGVQVSNADGALLHGHLPANATIAMDAATDNSVRWILGEDGKDPNIVGGLRDMWDPQCYGNPGKVSDKMEYACSANDEGGVHTNSGVDNHAYALMVDGGRYNGQSLTGIGLTKALHVYFRAKSVYQGPATDFADHADALEQSCADLVGVNLKSLTTGTASGEIITSADCAQVAKALVAVEMRNPPTQCDFQPLLAKSPPPLCASPKQVRSIFRTGFEGNVPTAANNSWTVSHSGTTRDFTPRDWTIVSNLPGNHTGRAYFGADPAIGSCAPGGDETAVLHLTSPQILLDAKVSSPQLAFTHYVATETGWDGGNLKISVNGGAWKIVKASDYVYNPYNGTLFTVADGNTDPIAGQPAFTGADGGEVTGSWGQSIVNLAPYAKKNDNIRLRWDVGNDGCGGNDGWYVDDVVLYQCQ